MTEATPLFVLGIEKRCGTNFLFDLLRLHPDVDMRLPIWEDYILSRSDPLVAFAADLTGLWREWWDLEEDEARRFLELLGDAIGRFLAGDSTASYVVVKTPEPTNVDRIVELFPRSPAILIVRDGRAVSESALRSWGRTIDETTSRWARNGRAIQSFLERHGDERRYLLVRYEDLVADTEAQLRRLFAALDLDPDRYDFAAAAELPVRGSSALQGGAETFHWDPVAKPPDFDPLRRHAGWDAQQLARFADAAGDVLEAFGYAR